MKSIIRFLATLALLFPLHANATPTQTNPAYITYLNGGWTNSSLFVVLNLPFYNPDGCTWTDGYQVNYQDSGNALFTSMLLSAYMANRKVQLTVDGCVTNRPHVIAVAILPSGY